MASKLNYGAALRKDMFVRADTHDMVLADVSKDGLLLRNVRHQTPDICCAAIRQNWRALQYVQQLNNTIVSLAVHTSIEAASLLPPAFHLHATCANVFSFDFIAKPTVECWRHVIEVMPDWISKRPHPPLEVCLVAVRRRFEEARFRARCNYPYIPAADALRKDYLAGIYVTQEVMATLQEAALKVTQGWALLEYPPADQARLVEAAVRLDPAIYSFVPHLQTAALNRIVCKADPKFLATIAKPPRDLVWEVATVWHVAIKYAEDQDEALCVHAVRKCSAAIAYVRKRRLHIWTLAGYRTIPQLTTLFPEFVHLMQESRAASAFFTRIQTAMTKKPIKTTEELEDPVTMEPVPTGTLCAFLADAKGTEHFAGTLDTLLDLLKARFQGSTVQNLFIPIKNTLVPTQLLKWRQI